MRNGTEVDWLWEPLSSATSRVWWRFPEANGEPIAAAVRLRVAPSGLSVDQYLPSAPAPPGPAAAGEALRDRALAAGRDGAGEWRPGV